MNRADKGALVGTRELAEQFGVTPAAVSNWQARWSDFPDPLVRLAMGPVWDATTVVPYIAGRRERGERTMNMIAPLAASLEQVQRPPTKTRGQGRTAA